MRRNVSSPSTFNRLRSLAAPIIFGSILGWAYGFHVVHAQCDYADLTGSFGPYPNSSFTYRIDSNTFGLGDAECLENAIYGPNFEGGGWNDNGIGVQFTPYTGQGGIQITIRHTNEGLNPDEAGGINIGRDSNGYATGGAINVNTNVSDCAALQNVLSHEMSHFFGLGDMAGQSGGTTMNQFSDWSDSLGWSSDLPTPCDLYQAWWVGSFQCESGIWWPNECPEDWEYDWYGCCVPGEGGPPPTLMTIELNGLIPRLQDRGVAFDIAGRGKATRRSWPSPLSPVGFLVMDRNENGVVDSGAEILGGAFPQRLPSCKWTARNALAQFDRPGNGGNGDGRFDSRDTEFKRLMVWFDYDGDGRVNAATQELIQIQLVGVQAFLLGTHRQTTEKSREKDHIVGTMRAEIWGGAQVSLYEISLRRK